MTSENLDAIAGFIRDQGLLTFMLLGFGVFFAAKIFPWFQKITETAIQFQTERSRQNDVRIAGWATMIMQQTSAIQQLTQLIETQHAEVLHRLDQAGKL